MILYDAGNWSVLFAFQYNLGLGSSTFKAMFIALPVSLLALLLSSRRRQARTEFEALDEVPLKDSLPIWGNFMLVLGGLILFRTRIAYTRYWEGVTLLQQMRGYWFNATSNLLAFTSTDPEIRRNVEEFDHLLVRLMSLLHCSALQQIAVMRDEHFEILGDHGIDRGSLQYLGVSHDRVEVLLQWIQRLIINNAANKVLPVAPPILSRVFQELSNGVVSVQKARKLSEIPFPFPYAQTITFALLIHMIATPAVTAAVCPSGAVAALVTFCAVAGLWSVNFIAAELELPFGDDVNDLPISQIQKDFNASLSTLLDDFARSPPRFAYDPDTHRDFSQTSRISCRITMHTRCAAAASRVATMRVRGSLYIEDGEDAEFMSSAISAHAFATDTAVEPQVSKLPSVDSPLSVGSHSAGRGTSQRTGARIFKEQRSVSFAKLNSNAGEAPARSSSPDQNNSQREEADAFKEHTETVGTTTESKGTDQNPNPAGAMLEEVRRDSDELEQKLNVVEADSTSRVVGKMQLAAHSEVEPKVALPNCYLRVAAGGEALSIIEAGKLSL